MINRFTPMHHLMIMERCAGAGAQRRGQRWLSL
jgi:hypothetical protein